MIKTKKGFTLIELLVVIAIIALLLSVILPSLRLAKQQAQKVICQSNLKQWGVIWYLYLEDNKSVFPTPWAGIPKQHWFTVVRPYYQDPKIRCCPVASDPTTKIDPARLMGGVREPWGLMPAAGPLDWWEEGDYGSYATNSWTENPPAGSTTFINQPAEYFWGKRTGIKSPSAVPLMGDSLWVDAWPLEADSPPLREEVDNLTSNMQRFCLNRHNGYAGMIFIDSSIKMVGLRELWTLKWHQKYNTANKWTLSGNGGNLSSYNSKWDAAAPWMTKFKAY